MGLLDNLDARGYYLGPFRWVHPLTSESGERAQKAATAVSFRIFMSLTLSTPSAHVADLQRRWFIVDVAGQPLGRISSKIASILRGKHTPNYTPHVDTGDFVVVINADKVKLTGNKIDTKFWYRHSAIPGGFKADPYRNLMENKPEFVIEKAIKGMLPKTPLGRKMHTKLKVYRGAEHPHKAQQPEVLAL